ncbi:hypothetical protein KKG36_01600 [Patescibacteria group bacterium]|nr:hypothetical protein [Patescibacteria group bacterium]
MYEFINKRSVLIFLVALLVVSSLGYTLFVYQDLCVAKKTIASYHRNEKILNFTNLLIDKVIRADREVSFEDRLALENSIREIKDDDIFRLWQQFVDAKTEFDAQQMLEELLDVLAGKISY